jgi:hypothetical protein
MHKFKLLGYLSPEGCFEAHGSVRSGSLPYQLKGVHKFAKFHGLYCQLAHLLFDHQGSIYYLKSKLLNYGTVTDLEGMVKVLGDKNTTSLSMVTISFLISTGLGSGFSRVMSLWVLYLTKLDSTIVCMTSEGVTVRF